MKKKNKNTQNVSGPVLEAKVVLTMIVKNESAVILRCLKSVIPFIDAYAIVDTGSDDGTPEIIDEFMKQHGIPGSCSSHTWKDFATARNASIDHGRKVANDLGLSHVFGFWIDADEELIISPGFSKELRSRALLFAEGANLKVTLGSHEYARTQMYKLDLPWVWKGPVHEVLSLEGRKPNIIGVAGVGILVRSDGNSWTSESQKEKYQKHADILLKYVESQENPEPRWVFYLAQSYKDTGDPENYKNAIKWYSKRLEMEGGFWEEKYESAIMMGSMMARANESEPEIIQHYMTCGKYNKFRVEHLVPVVLYYQRMRDFETAYIFSSHMMKYAGRSPFPNSVMFVDMNVYNWKIYAMHAYNCHYTNRVDERRAAWVEVMKAQKAGKIPPSSLEAIMKNDKILR